MRQQIRIKSRSNDIDIKFTSKLKTEDVFHIIKELFPTQKEYEALIKYILCLARLFTELFHIPTISAGDVFHLSRRN